GVPGFSWGRIARQVNCQTCGEPYDEDSGEGYMGDCPECADKAWGRDQAIEHGEGSSLADHIEREIGRPDANWLLDQQKQGPSKESVMHPVYATDNPFTDDNPFQGDNNPFGKADEGDAVPDNPVGPQDADAFTDAGMNNSAVPLTTKPRVVP